MNTTLTPTENHIAQTKPWKRKYQAYDLDKDRTIYFENPHGKAAKRLYKQYIDYGFEPEMQWISAGSSASSSPCFVLWKRTAGHASRTSANLVQ